MAFQKPETAETALYELISDIDSTARDKVGTINRLRNTIVYAEKIRMEWEARAQSALLSQMEDHDEATKNSLGQSQNSVIIRPHDGSDSPSALSGLGFGFGSFRSDDFGDHGEPGHLVMEEDDPTLKIPLEGMSRLSLGQSLSAKSPNMQSVSTIPLALPPTSSINTLKKLPSGHSSPRGSPTVGPHALPGDVARRVSLAGSPSMTGIGVPLSPRLSGAIPNTRSRPSSIKDFEIIKPISKGAFGSVYLAKKKTTGDYYAIKVLKKSDMVAKNQVTNVKSERTILMLASGADTDFVVKLFYTFQSSEYLYLVMEYLNGGDCAALIKALGSLEEEWVQSYIAEVILGVEELHSRGIVHRDLKPDNLLIDSSGHLKLTDFGLSKIGLLGRQSKGSHLSLFPRQGDPRSDPSTPSDVGLTSSGPQTTASHRNSYFPLHRENSEALSESSGSDALAKRPFSSVTGLDLTGVGSSNVARTSDKQKHAQGTPDYLAPET